MKWMLIRAFEAWAVATLLRSQAFHRGVEKIAKGVHRLRHGRPMEEMGGTKIDMPEDARFWTHFKNELRQQLGMKNPKQR
ncbi:uncharacterized protein PV09_07672 [Verruconis gallopava]|uniref:Uncharacterized protein n=1 Tax=Verruconis gallopava TaxID=253628 RepID=A0A0D1YJ73_9PEZI|nr:uncharacterized protein PV09_07672 [Verruconis gallopava]KIW00932.1 hypothetical protein PV09_07672 [Verruconis gallopava]